MAVGRSRAARSEAPVTVVVAAAAPELEAASGAGAGAGAAGAAAEEIGLETLVARSAPLAIQHASLAQGLDNARRLDAHEWLVQAFDALNLPDAQLFSAFGLLDRFAAASPAPISAGPGAFALVLAAMLVALKVEGTQRDLERAKRLVTEVSGSSRPWAAVRKAELCILRRVGFRACAPTARHLLDRLATDLRKSPQVTAAWGSDMLTRATDLARFLLELGVVHDAEAVYGGGLPPLAPALMALRLALLATGAPRQCAEALQEPLEALGGVSTEALSNIAQALRQRWAAEERRAEASSGGSAVMEKWLRRMGALGVPVPSLQDVQQLAKAAPPQPPAASKLQPAAAAAGAGGAAPCESGAGLVVHQAAFASAKDSAGKAGNGPDFLSCIPTPARRAASSMPAPSEQKPASVPVASDAVATSAANAHGALATNGETGQPATGTGSTASSSGGASTIPDEVCTTAARLPPHTITLGSGAQAMRHGTPPGVLVELTQVLNMIVPRPPHGGGISSLIGGSCILGGGSNRSNAGRRSPAVAAELLGSSALRMQWPVDRRKVCSSDAAGSCREAAAALQEAAAQLLSTAGDLEAATAGGAGSAPESTGAAAPAAPAGSARGSLGRHAGRQRLSLGEGRAQSPRDGSSGATRAASPQASRFAGLRV